MNLFEADLSNEHILEMIEPEIIDITDYKREQKPKATYGELFEKLTGHHVILDTLTDEDKSCPVCGTQMFQIGTEVARTELVYYPAVSKRVEYIATTYECPYCITTKFYYQNITTGKTKRQKTA